MEMIPFEILDPRAKAAWANKRHFTKSLSVTPVAARALTIKTTIMSDCFQQGKKKKDIDIKYVVCTYSTANIIGLIKD